MSLDYSIYLGPYVECKVPYGPVKKMVQSCSNTKCNRNILHQYVPAPYCQACGSQTGTIVYEEEGETVDYETLEKELNDKLFWATQCGRDLEKRLNHYLPNKKIEGLERQLHSGDHFLGVEDLLDVDREREVSLFAKQFAKEIQALEKAYGFESVRVRWGLVGSVI